MSALYERSQLTQVMISSAPATAETIQSNYSGRCYDYGHEFSYVIGMARDVLINHTRC